MKIEYGIVLFNTEAKPLEFELIKLEILFVFGLNKLPMLIKNPYIFILENLYL